MKLSTYFTTSKTLRLFVLCLAAYSSLFQVASAERPSVLFLNIDDWNDWNSVLKGHPQAITPNLERFASRSVTFTRAICSSPVCFPSRTSLFSGLHPSRTGAKSNPNWGNPWRSYVPDAVTLPKLFSAQGWKSVGIGKNFHKGDKAEFDQYIGRGKEPKVIPETYRNINSSGRWGVAAVPTTEMPDYISVSRGIRVLEANRDSLFLSLGIYRPHVPWVVPQEYFDRHPSESLVMPEHRADDLDDLPERFKLMAHNEGKFGPNYHRKVVAAGDDKNMVRAYLACVSFADEQVGRILDAWYASPHAESGYVVLWSDHGYQLSEKEGWSKMKPWFDSARVNLMIAGPDLAGGVLCDKAVSLLDLYPTLVELLQLRTPPQLLDGNSLVPLLKNPKTEWDKPVLMSSEADGIRYDVVLDNGYRMTRLATGETELYKLDNDPHEFTNLASKPEYAEVIAKLSQHLSFKHPKAGKDGWLEAETLPHQTSSDYGQRGNFHYPKDQADASQGQVVCADLRMGAGSYIEFVVNIETAGDYEISVAVSAQGPCLLSTAVVVNDALQADSGYPMKKLLSIEKSKAGAFEVVSAGSVTFKQAGLHLLRFSSQVKRQLLQIDRIQLKKRLPKVLATSATAADSTSADVIVYGATPGGFCAAIAAAREGASVILLEPTDHVGAMSTGGLSHCDSNQMVRKTLMGLFDEWHRRVVKDYTDRGLKAPYNPAKKDQSKWTFEPHVAMRVTMQMLDEAGVKVLTERYLKSVTKEGPRITSLVTKNGTFTARVFVDGSYEGDLMAAAGVDWTIGREGRAEYGESLAGKQYPKKKMNINGFDEEGRLLPLLTSDDAGGEEAGDKNIMTYSFRLCLTTDPENRVPMPEPDNYDPARFELIRRYLQAGGNAVGFDAYPLPANQILGIGTLPLPNRKFDGNNSIGRQFSIGLIGGGTGWHTADEAGRKKIWEAHKQYTLEFIHFLTTDPVVPVKVRNKYNKLGLCKDEFANYDHFPPALYVRESRRMKGMYVISQKDILESPEKDDPIAISSFPIDSHDCQRIALKGGGVINEGTIFPVRKKNPKQGYAYHVPYRSILPKPGQCDNLLVPIALSCTHVGISSLRIEGAWMVIGQGAGVAAALAAKENVPVQELHYAKLRKRLLAQKQVLDLPEASDKPTASVPRSSSDPKTLQGIVLDDEDATLTGHWARSTNFKPFVGRGYIHDERKGDGKSTATFRFKAPKSGRYQVLMAYSAHETRAKKVPVSVTSGTYSRNIVVDQTTPLPGGKRFRLIGTVDLKANVETVVQISNGSTDGFVILDALQLLPIESELK